MKQHSLRPQFFYWLSRQLHLRLGEVNSENSWPTVENIRIIYLGNSILLATHGPKQTTFPHNFSLSNCCLLMFYKSWSKPSNIWIISSCWKLELIGNSPGKLVENAGSKKSTYFHPNPYFSHDLMKPSARQVLAFWLPDSLSTELLESPPSQTSCDLFLYWSTQNWILICPEGLPEVLGPWILSPFLKMAFTIRSQWAFTRWHL